MLNQTPPVVSDEQRAKWMQVTEDRIRKGKLDGPSFQYILGHPELTGRLGKIFDELAAEYRRNLSLIERPPFLTIKVGTLKTEADLRQAVLDAGCKIGDWASDLMNQPAFTAGIVQVEEEVDFVIASNAELGYPDGCTRAKSYEAGLGLGWKLCQPSDPIEIRRSYPDQPMGEWLIPAIESIADSDGNPKVFCLGRDGVGRWLNASFGYPDLFWSGGRRWVFRRK